MTAQCMQRPGPSPSPRFPEWQHVYGGRLRNAEGKVLINSQAQDPAGNAMWGEKDVSLSPDKQLNQKKRIS